MSDLTPGFTAVSTMPRWFEFFRPLLEVLADGQTWRKRDMERAIAARAGLTEEQLAETIGSGQSRAINRIGWATSALRRVKAIESPARAQFRITDVGRKLLADHAGPIPESAVYALPAYNEYVPVRGKKAASFTPVGPELEESDPDELISSGIRLIDEDTRSTLLQRLKESDPYDFERVVRTLLVRMGYGRDGRMTPLTARATAASTVRSIATSSVSARSTCRPSGTPKRPSGVRRSRSSSEPWLLAARTSACSSPRAASPPKRSTRPRACRRRSLSSTARA